MEKNVKARKLQTPNSAESSLNLSGDYSVADGVMNEIGY